MKTKSKDSVDLTAAVSYHYDRFPPTSFNYSKIIKPLSSAASSLARYDQMLKGMHNSEILLAPLRSQEAVVSSRMEGTISTIDEVLRYEADQEADSTDAISGARNETVEVFLYGRAMKFAQSAIKEGQPVSDWLIRSAHQILLGFGRGARMSPGLYKTCQNYLADRSRKQIMFIPITPERLPDGLEKLFAYINDSGLEPLLKTAIAHLEFEALHPFNDGNGRIGRMLIPLILWKENILSQPHFYASAFFEEHRDDYIDHMRAVSANDTWTDWIVFFLNALDEQARENLLKAEEIRSLYEEMKIAFRDTLSSQWGMTALDFVFTRPIFRNNVFTGKSGIPPATAQRFVRALIELGLLTTLVTPSGRRPGMYAFEPLLRLVRA